MARGGEIFEIQITGLKQGEKMGEELLGDPTGFDDSEHSDIMVLRSENEPLLDLESRILELVILSRKADSQGLLRKLQEMVPA